MSGCLDLESRYVLIQTRLLLAIDMIAHIKLNLVHLNRKGTKLWKKLSDVPSPRCAHSANIIHGGCFSKDPKTQYIIIFGGWNGSNHIFNDFLIYNIGNGIIEETTGWQTGKDRLIEARFGHASCSSIDANKGTLNDGVIIFGGVNVSQDMSDIIIVRLNDE